MIDRALVETIRGISDDRSGDHAQDGFDYQYSTAIYTMFEYIENKKKFSLIYEKVEDFLIISNDINLYQSKSTSKDLTEGLLTKRENKKQSSDDDADETEEIESKEVGISILEKLHKNINLVKSNVTDVNVFAHLLWNGDYRFGKNLIKDSNIKIDSDTFTMAEIKDDIKTRIMTTTGINDYDWDKLKVIRLLSKKKHKELTCSYIEKVIYSIVGENKSYSVAFYESLFQQLHNRRMDKQDITSEFVTEKIENTRDKSRNEITPHDYEHLISSEDFRDNFLHVSVNKQLSMIELDHYPEEGYFDKVYDYVHSNQDHIRYPYKLSDELSKDPDFIELYNVLEIEDIKAMIVVAYLKVEGKI